ncbi:MAG TPA: J domain-containing protein [Dongiaceae bacterium]|nr:J domain-containing protein [Dongiaceae bacterium]
MSANPTGGAAAPKPPANKESTAPATGPTGAAATPAFAPTAAAAATPTRATFSAGPQRPAIPGGHAKGDPMGRYLDLLGIRPGATLDEINTAYFTLVKRFPENPTEEDEAAVQEVRRAYDIVRRRYVPPKTKAFQIVFDKRVMIPLMAVSVVALGGMFLWMNWNNVRVSTTHYEAGAVLRLPGAATPYGTVTGYESTHKFPAGVPSPAYSIKLTDKEETVWVSERLVVLGMVPAGN